MKSPFCVSAVPNRPACFISMLLFCAAKEGALLLPHLLRSYSIRKSLILQGFFKTFLIRTCDFHICNIAGQEIQYNAVKYTPFFNGTDMTALLNDPDLCISHLSR